MPIIGDAQQLSKRVLNITLALNIGSNRLLFSICCMPTLQFGIDLCCLVHFILSLATLPQVVRPLVTGRWNSDLFSYHRHLATIYFPRPRMFSWDLTTQCRRQSHGSRKGRVPWASKASTDQRSHHPEDRTRRLLVIRHCQ